jgi:hypothetical protein
MTIDGQEFVLVPKEAFEELTCSVDNSNEDVDTSDLAINNLSFECCSETENDLFEFSVLVDEEIELVANDMVSITWTNKRIPKADWKEQYWDNPTWLVNLIHTNNRSTIDEFPKEIDQYGFRVVQELVKKVIDLGWLDGETK